MKYDELMKLADGSSGEASQNPKITFETVAPQVDFPLPEPEGSFFWGFVGLWGFFIALVVIIYFLSSKND